MKELNLSLKAGLPPDISNQTWTEISARLSNMSVEPLFEFFKTLDAVDAKPEFPNVVNLLFDYAI